MGTHRSEATRAPGADASGEASLAARALDALAEAVVTADDRGRITLLNRAAEALTGWTAADAIGRPVSEVLVTLDAAGARCESALQCALLDRTRIARADRVLVSRDGVRREVVEEATPILAAHGEVAAAVVVRDATHARHRDSERARAERLESLGVLAGGIAHDYNNLLTTILGNVSLARLIAGANASLLEPLDLAEQACRRAKRLSDQILTFSRGADPTRAPVALERVVREALATLDRADVVVRIEAAARLWPTAGDANQLGHAIANVARNGCEAMPHGGTLTVRVDNHDGDTPPDGAPRGVRYVRIAITDEGAGIAPENLDRVFDPYFTTKPAARGLGLSTAYSIVRNHGGRIVAEPATARGTTITLYLPASDATAEAQATVGPGAVAGARILVMDDDAFVLRTLAAMLEHLGHDVERTEDGAAAVAAYERAREAGSPFDLVILDLVVAGGVGGRDALLALRAIDPAVKAVVSSGYSNDPTLTDHKSHGFCDLVAKPYDIAELSAVVQRWTARTQ